MYFKNKKNKTNKLRLSLINNQEIQNNENIIYEYCDICEELILNKYFEYHCPYCNKCHYKNKIFCKYCKECYNPSYDFEIIKHKKVCKYQK